MYSNALRYFMSYLKIPADRYDLLLDPDPKIIQMNICDYVSHLKNSGVIASRSIAVDTLTGSINYALETLEQPFNPIIVRFKLLLD